MNTYVLFLVGDDFLCIRVHPIYSSLEDNSRVALVSFKSRKKIRCGKSHSSNRNLQEITKDEFKAGQKCILLMLLGKRFQGTHFHSGLVIRVYIPISITCLHIF